MRNLFDVYAGEVERKDLQSARMISSKWRRISFESPELWTGLEIHPPERGTYGDYTMLLMADKIIPWFSRSGSSLPLNLILTDDARSLDKFPTKLINFISSNGLAGKTSVPHLRTIAFSRAFPLGPGPT